MKNLVRASLLVSLSFAAGCQSSLDSRIAEKSAVFEKLSLDQQETIRAQGVEKGFTPEMVYMALGSPSKIEAGSENGVAVEVWSYSNYRPGFYGKKSNYDKSAGSVPMSKGSSYFHSLPSEGGGRGDVNLMDGYGRSGNSPSVPDDGPVFTFRILFFGGKVLSTKLAQ